MSPVRLLVLGVLRLRGQAHGYAVHRELAAWRVDTWTRVKPGSVYHALKQLSKERKIKAVSVEESAEGPGRTRYELTQKGHAEFLALLEEALSSMDIIELSAGVAFMQALSRPHVLRLLKAQHLRAQETRDGLEALKAHFPRREDPPHTPELLDLWGGSLSATIAWMGGLIHRLEAGEYVMAGERRA
ncbi:MAG: PadR family transcriptional regulator [Myxococcota bacterium]